MWAVFLLEINAIFTPHPAIGIVVEILFFEWKKPWQKKIETNSPTRDAGLEVGEGIAHFKLIIILQFIYKKNLSKIRKAFFIDFRF